MGKKIIRAMLKWALTIILFSVGWIAVILLVIHGDYIFLIPSFALIIYPSVHSLKGFVDNIFDN